MTRLIQADVNKIAATLISYNEELIQKTGCSLREIAIRAVGLEKGEFNEEYPLVAVIPMTCGLGIIEGFVESVATIISFLGFEVLITESSDAGGVAEAVQRGAAILFMADDDRFVAVNLKTGQVSDNGLATGKGYIAALERACAGLMGQRVLLIGAGPVGNGAALALMNFGAVISVYDIEPSASQRLARTLAELGYNITIETDLDAALGRHHIVVDACPAKDLIMLRHITEDMIVAAPGIPLGIQAEGIGLLTKRLIHDSLQIGVATMIFEVSLSH